MKEVSNDVLNSRKINADSLRVKVKEKFSESLDFCSTHQVKSLDSIIGQERAQESMRVALGIDIPGYNIFVGGPNGCGKLTTIKKMLKGYKGSDFRDFAYVHNFDNPEKPVLLELAPGDGKKLDSAIKKTITDLRTKFRECVCGEEFTREIAKVSTHYNSRIRRIEKRLDSFGLKEKDEDIELEFREDGTIGPPVDVKEKECSESDYELKKSAELSVDDKVEISRLESKLRKLERTGNDKIVKLRKKAVKKIVRPEFSKLHSDFNYDRVKKFLRGVEKHLITNNEILTTDVIVESGGGKQVCDIVVPEYGVQVLVDRAKFKSPPVVFEENPTIGRVFGVIQEATGLLSKEDSTFQDIKSGSVHDAMGGVLILDTYSLTEDVYEHLVSNLKSGKITMQGNSWFFDSSLNPEPMPADLKVILTGDSWFYYYLHDVDPSFAAAFRCFVDFDDKIRLDDDVVLKYSRFAAKTCRENKLKHLSPDGVAAVVEEAMRSAESNKDASLVFNNLASLIIESNYWAKQEDTKLITEEHVEKAVRSKNYRLGRIEDRIQELIKDQIIMIDTSEKRVGQINGLSVWSIGGYSFGIPSKTTAVTSVGGKGIVHVDRETGQSGPSHTKGVKIIEGYLKNVFAQDKPLALDVSLTFEQEYECIDGDSASSTELYAVLSSLTKIPIKQNIAVTGSVNQFGEIQPIGGVNDKIEGFFYTCKHSKEGLTGAQGVMVPYSNRNELMLNKEVVKAVDEGEFNIYFHKTIEDGFETLTDVVAGSVDEQDTALCAANERLKIFYRALKRKE